MQRCNCVSYLLRYVGQKGENNLLLFLENNFDSLFRHTKRSFHETLPMSGAFLNRISVRFRKWTVPRKSKPIETSYYSLRDISSF